MLEKMYCLQGIILQYYHHVQFYMIVFSNYDTVIQECSSMDNQVKGGTLCVAMTVYIYRDVNVGHFYGCYSK